MKLADLLPTSQELPIKYPDGGETGIVLTVLSADSRQFHAVVSRHAQASLGREDEIPISERQQRMSEQVAACVAGWRGIDDAPYSPERAVELMANPELSWIREQVEAAVTKRSNFFRRGQAAAGAAGAAVGKAEHAKPNGKDPSPDPGWEPPPGQEGRAADRQDRPGAPAA